MFDMWQDLNTSYAQSEALLRQVTVKEKAAMTFVICFRYALQIGEQMKLEHVPLWNVSHHIIISHQKKATVAAFTDS